MPLMIERQCLSYVVLRNNVPFLGQYAPNAGSLDVLNAFWQINQTGQSLPDTPFSLLVKNLFVVLKLKNL